MQGRRVFYFNTWLSRDAAGRRIQGSLRVSFDAVGCKVAGLFFRGRRSTGMSIVERAMDGLERSPK
jgi:hypothetical protein